MIPDRDIEARLAALEQAIARTPTDVVTLREFIETKLDSNQRALDLATDILNKRLEGMNEFRDTLRDQASRFVTRDELALQIDRLNERVTELKTSADRLSGKADAKAVYISYVIAGLGLILSAVSLLSSL